jgi:hypothetical protein
MEDNFTIEDCLFWDEFNLPLQEDSLDEYYTIDEIKHEVEKRIAELNKIGYKFSANQVVRYAFLNHNRTTAGTNSVDDHKYVFAISKQAARKKNEKYLDNIIYHELCHMLQLEYLFDNELFYYENGKRTNAEEDQNIIDDLLGKDGHTAFWQIFVNKVNRVLLVNPPVAARLSDKDVSDIFLEGTFTSRRVESSFDGFWDDFGYSDYLKRKTDSNSN